MSTLPKARLTEEEYLEIERKAEFKSEFYDGEMFAMAGAREAHNLIVTNLVRELSQLFRSRPCRVYSNDMRVRVSPKRNYTYPDVVVICGEPHFLDQQRDTLLNPTLIVEVLSKSTEMYDRGKKFWEYRRIDSLSDYLLIGSELVSAELFSRAPDGRWVLTAADTLDATIEIPSIACTLRLADLYEKVEFPEAG